MTASPTTSAPARPTHGSNLSLAEHEQVIHCSDPASGLRAIIAIHNTALGPALGGTRFYPYASDDEALADVLRLSRGMSYKNAVAGIPHGGGKAVIIGDPATLKTPELLRAYGRFVESLGGRYVTACDVGTYVQDMDVVAETTRFATGRSPEKGGAGDSSVLTAFGVFQGMRAAAQHLWGEPTLRGRRVGIAGVGKVGRILAGHLVEDGAQVVVTDVNAAAVDGPAGRPPRHREPGRRRCPRARRPRRLRPLRPGWRARRRHRRRPQGPHRLRRRQQPARDRGRRAAPPTASSPAASPTAPTSSSTPAESSR